MINIVGWYIQAVREKKALSRGQLAREMDCGKVSKVAFNITRFERGEIDLRQEVLDRLIEVLELDRNEVYELIEKERLEREEEERKAFEEWASYPEPMHLVIRLFAACYCTKTLPPEITTEEQALEYARDFAQHGFGFPVKVCLVLSRRESIWIDKNGDYVRSPTKQGGINRPVMRIRGKGKIHDSKNHPKPSCFFHVS